MWYVTITDTFLSGWGCAENKINKLVLECETLADARIVKQNAELRSDMKFINIVKTKPSYNKTRYLTSFKNKETYPCWYTPKYFAK